MKRSFGKPRDVLRCHNCLGAVFIQKECRDTGLVVRDGVPFHEHAEGRFVGLICKNCSAVLPKEALKRFKFKRLLQNPLDSQEGGMRGSRCPCGCCVFIQKERSIAEVSVLDGEVVLLTFPERPIKYFSCAKCKAVRLSASPRPRESSGRLRSN